MMSNFLKKIFIESNMHGFSLVFNSRHHPLERLLWIALIVTSIFFATETCNKEWRRYEDSSVVLSFETNHRSWEYLVPGFTICTDIFDGKRADNLIEKSWGISKNDSKFVIYKKFVEVVTVTTYGNLQRFGQFLNDSFLDQLDMLKIAKEMREYLMPNAGFNLVTTEMGVCFSSTYLYLLQNVSDRIVSTKSPTGEFCRSTLSAESCNLKIASPIPSEKTDDYNQTMFLHNLNDVLNPTKATKVPFLYEVVTTVELIINAIVSSNKIQQLSPSQRKCYFENEEPLKYFGIYTTTLCLISCRIDAAVTLCGCIPFFYRINPVDYPICTIQGMICLSDKWFPNVFNSSEFDRGCNCLPLCSNYEYVKSTIRNEIFPDFYSLVEVSVIFPKSRLKRGVVYSADNLLVAFGGVFGLYLGCSFISVVEFLFFVLEFLIEKITSVLKRICGHKVVN